MEVALSCEDVNVPDGEEERRREGDIIAIREPLGRFGQKERHAYLWLAICGFENDELVALATGDEAAQVSTEALASPDDWELYGDGTQVKIYDKRRYCIPFDVLQMRYRRFDPDMARDLNRDYQPFMNGAFKDDDGTYEDLVCLNARGLVFDKRLMRFL